MAAAWILSLWAVGAYFFTSAFSCEVRDEVEGIAYPVSRQTLALYAEREQEEIEVRGESDVRE
jgi:hypothetical protein